MSRRIALVALIRLTGILVLLLPGVWASPRVVVAADDGDAPWAAVRRGFPAGQTMYRATWLPERFGSPQFNTNPYGVIYQGDTGERLTFAFELNYADEPLQPPTRSVLYTVHGQPAYLLQPAIGPDRNLAPPFIFEIGWQEAGTTYRVRLDGARQPGSAGGELILIVGTLAPIGADGAVAPQCFTATGQCIGGRFLADWLTNGGLARNGYPLTGEFRQTVEDGQSYMVQYFERARLEWHPQNNPFNQVQRGQFGRRIFRERTGRETDPPVPQAGPIYFHDTGHNLSGPFLDYFQRNGGIGTFGMPLTEAFPEQLEDGHTYHVQYFERARMEYHPENEAPYDVLLGQFGRRILAEQRAARTPQGVPAIRPGPARRPTE